MDRIHIYIFSESNMNELEPLRGIPHELDASAKEWEQTPRIWVPNEKDGYALATVLAENANSGK